jgi:O-antigen/teichoic acid export membrane protein
MGFIQKDAFRTMVFSYVGIALGYLNKVVLFLIILTTEQIGLVNLLITTGTLFAQFSNFGVSFIIWKFFPFFRNGERRHHGFLPFILLITFAGIAVCTLLALIFRGQIEALYMEKSPLFSAYYVWMIPIGIAYAVFVVVEAYLRSLYHNVVAVIAYEMVLRIAVAITLLLLWPGWITFRTFVVLNSVIYIIPTLILLVYLNRIGELGFRFSDINIPARFRKIIFGSSSFYYVNALGMVLVNSMDLLMIGQMLRSGLVAVGVYSTVVFVAAALQVPYRSILRISSPLVSDYWKQREHGKMRELYVKVSSVSLFIGLGLFILCWVNIDFLLSFLKPEFAAGKWTFFFLMIGRLVDMYFGLNGSIFTTSKKYRYDILFTVFLIVAVFGLNLWLIPKWGISGAAISTSVALIVYNSGRMLFVYYFFGLHLFERKQLYVIALAALAVTVDFFMPQLFAGKWLQMLVDTAVAGVLFFLPALIFRLEPETLSYFRKGWHFVRGRLMKDPPVELP